jgi:glycosyltransferase involved in cell wall biosynthesis
VDVNLIPLEVNPFTCDDAAPRGETAGLPYRGSPRLVSASVADLLAERPVCVALYPTGRPPWVYDLLAAGCPVIAVAACLEPPGAGPEREEGFIAAPAEAATLSRAIDALLIDRIRMSALCYRAAARVRDLADAREAARTLLDALDAAVAPDAGAQAQRQGGRGPRDPLAQVA